MSDISFSLLETCRDNLLLDEDVVEDEEFPWKWFDKGCFKEFDKFLISLKELEINGKGISQNMNIFVVFPFFLSMI